MRLMRSKTSAMMGLRPSFLTRFLMTSSGRGTPIFPPGEHTSMRSKVTDCEFKM